MNILSNSDRLNRIVEIWHSQANAVNMVDYPGIYAKCSGTFTELKFAEATFDEAEVENGAPIEQQLDIIIRGQNKQSDIEAIDIAGNYLILKLVYYNGDIKVVGTKENPVVLQCTTSGTPVETKFSTKRFSAEKAKYLL